MFNTTRVYNTTNHPRTLEVKEHRAPTDESARLLKELEQEAMNKIVAMGKVEDNKFNTKWYILQCNADFEQTCKCIFTLNGKEYDLEFRLPHDRYQDSSNIIPQIRERIIEKLGQILLEDLFKNCDKTLVQIYKPFEK